MRSFTCSDNWNHLVRYRSLQTKSGPRNAFRPRWPNWQLVGLLPPTQAPVLGSIVETKASGLSHWMVPGCVIPAIELCWYTGTPGTTLAYCGPLPWMMPFPLAVYGALKTENGKPLCQNAVPDICHPFSARASKGLRALMGN